MGKEQENEQKEVAVFNLATPPAKPVAPEPLPDDTPTRRQEANLREEMSKQVFMVEKRGSSGLSDGNVAFIGQGRRRRELGAVVHLVATEIHELKPEDSFWSEEMRACERDIKRVYQQHLRQLETELRRSTLHMTEIKGE